MHKNQGDSEIASSPFMQTWRTARAHAEKAERKIPVWARDAADAFKGDAPLANAGLMTPILPLAGAARRAVRTCVMTSPLAPTHEEGRHALMQSLEASLMQRLQQSAMNTLVLELGVAAEHGLLAGDTPSTRYAFFCECLQDGAFAAALLAQYPALTRRLVTLADNWARATCEMLTRLAADRTRICSGIFASEDEGALIGATMLGDPHVRGRGVHRLQFASGLRLIYKPRPPAMEAAMFRFLAWANKQGLSPDLCAPAAIDCGTYGWVRNVEAAPCADLTAVHRFYRRQGANLALTYMLGATDLHFENIIAAGEYPVIVDWETLFQAKLPNDASGASAAALDVLNDSVSRTLMLPLRIYGDAHGAGRRSADVSALGYAEPQEAPFAAPNWDLAGTDDMRLVRQYGLMPLGEALPVLDGRRVPARDHVAELEAGFAEAYRFFLRHRRSLLAANGPLAQFKGRTVRHVFRPTAHYFQLLNESWHPEHGRSTRKLEDHLRGRLIEFDGAAPKDDVVYGGEVADLLDGDVPYFQSAIGARHAISPLRPDSSTRLSSEGWRATIERVSQMCEADMERQIWVTRVAFADLQARNTPARAKPAAFRRQDIEALASNIGDRLCDLAIVRGGRASWLYPMIEDERHFTPASIGFDLYHGLAGVALFLGRLSLISKRVLHREMASAAIAEALALERKTARYGANLGAFDGVAGLAYALALLGVWLSRPEWTRKACRLIRAQAASAARLERVDLISGGAGFLAAGVAISEIAAAPALLDALQPLAAALPTCAAPGDADAGLAHGKAGIGFALARWADASGEKAARRAAIQWIKADITAARDARVTAQRAGGKTMLAWCRGDLGASLALLQLGESPGPAQRVVRQMQRDGMGDFAALCPCHGLLGAVEFLECAAQAGIEGAKPLARAARGAALGRLSAGELCSDHSHRLETPGLLIGLAGTGYWLLRRLDARTTPLTLMLDPR